MKTQIKYLISILLLSLLLCYCGKRSDHEETSISDLLEYLRENDFSIGEVMDYPILAIQNCKEGRMVKINKETVIILEFTTKETSSRYALTYAGTEKSYKTYSVGRFVIRSEDSYDVGKAVKEKLVLF